MLDDWFPSSGLGTRNVQIEWVMNATDGMYGDLQGIAGKSLQEIEGLEMRALGWMRIYSLNLKPKKLTSL